MAMRSAGSSATDPAGTGKNKSKVFSRGAGVVTVERLLPILIFFDSLKIG
jgi:hypothetical protein